MVFIQLLGNLATALCLAQLLSQPSLAASASETKTISDLDILLPANKCSNNECNEVKYPLTATNGCYNWSISHPALVNMAPKSAAKDSCVGTMMLRSATSFENTGLIRVTATDTSSGYIHRSNVKVSVLDSLKLKIRYNQLINVNDIFKLKVNGIDRTGSTFSSLDGLTFKWEFIQGSDLLVQVEAPGTARKYLTQAIYLKGLKAGYATVRVSIIEPGYEQVVSTEVKLIIVDPFEITPIKPVYLLPTSKYQFGLDLLTINMDNRVAHTPIQIPHTNYNWSVLASDTSFPSVKNCGIFSSGVKEEVTHIEVAEVRMPENTAQAAINVVFPHMLTVEMADITEHVNQMKHADFAQMLEQISGDLHFQAPNKSNMHIFVEEHFYVMRISLLDKNDNLIHRSTNLRFEVSSPHLSLLDILHTDATGAIMVFKTPKIDQESMKFQAKFRLSTVKSETGEEFAFETTSRLNIEQTLLISMPVKIRHPTSLILLPFYENIGQEWTVKAKGGSGVYDWEISDASVAHMSIAETQAILTSGRIGKATLIVRDHQNPINSNIIEVEVSEVDYIKWLEPRIEMQIDQEYLINLMAFDQQNRKFTNCTSLNPELIQNDIIQDQDNNANIQAFVDGEMDLLRLSQRFAEQPDIQLAEELDGSVRMSDELIRHNKFGICHQSLIKGHFEGLIRMTASVDQESEITEVVVFSPLARYAPSKEGLFADLNSKLPVDYQNFNSFLPLDRDSLSHGSAYTLTLHGGSNYWSDIEYMTSVIKTDQNDSILDTATTRQQTADFDVQMSCKPRSRDCLGKSFMHEIMIAQQSVKTRSLLRPFHHSISQSVDCFGPDKVKLLWAQNSSELANLPRKLELRSKQRYYALVNSEHFVRYLVFDSRSQMSLNHESVAASVTSSNPDRAALSEGAHDKRAVRFSDSPGSVTLTVQLTGYLLSLPEQKKQNKGVLSWLYTRQEATQPTEDGLIRLENQIVDSLDIEVVEQFDVLPRSKTLYVNKDSLTEYSLDIEHGSGYFLVSIDNTDLVVDFVHKDRKVSFKPKRKGIVILRVEDLQLADSPPIFVTLTFSEIHGLQLRAPRTLIEEGDEEQVTVVAIDCNGIEFDGDQYAYMLFEIEAESTGISARGGLAVTMDQDNNRFFTVKGENPGNYQVIAKSFAISTEMLLIEVFPLLEITPNELLLTPNMRHVLSVEGGPMSLKNVQDGNQIEIIFRITDDSIAQVDKNWEVKALQVGDTFLQYEIVQQKVQNSEQRRISRKMIPIRVRIPTAVEVHSTDHRQVYDESSFKAFAVLKYGEETFNFGIGPISYSWTTDSSSVLSLDLPSHSDLAKTPIRADDLILSSRSLRDNLAGNERVFHSSYNSSSVHLAALREGTGIVNVQAAIEYPERHGNEKNWFASSASVNVVSKLEVQAHRENEDYSRVYLLPPNSLTSIWTNKQEEVNLRIIQDNEVASSPLISTEGQKIRTYSKYGKASLLVEEKGNFPNQLALIFAKVRDIFSVQVMQKYAQLVQPMGLEQSLDIDFFDEHNNQFAYRIREGLELGIELSHPNVVQVKLGQYNQTLLVKSVGTGQCNVKVYLKNRPQIFDVFKVQVALIVRPDFVNLHLGGSIKYQQVNLLQTESHWTSTDPETLAIESSSGIAMGLKKGPAQVKLDSFEGMVSQVHVKEVESAQVLQTDPLMVRIDQANVGQELRTRVQFFLDKTATAEVMPSAEFNGITLVRHNIGIRCISDNPAFISAHGEVLDLEGFFCVMKYVGKDTAKVTPTFVGIKVEAFSLSTEIRRSNYPKLVTQFDVRLISAIRIETKYRLGISLSNQQRSATVRIKSSSDFTIKASNSDDVKYSLAKESADQHDYLLTVTVPSTRQDPLHATLLMENDRVREPTILHVNYELFDHPAQASAPSYEPEPRRWSAFWSYLIMAVCVILTVWFVMVKICKKDPIEQLNKCHVPKLCKKAAKEGKAPVCDDGNLLRRPCNQVDQSESVFDRPTNASSGRSSTQRRVNQPSQQFNPRDRSILFRSLN